MATESQHPTPWRVGERTVTRCEIRDANSNWVMATPTLALAQAVVTAVNEKAEREAAATEICGVCGQSFTAPVCLPRTAPARGEAPRCGPGCGTVVGRQKTPMYCSEACCDAGRPLNPTGPAPGARAPKPCKHERQRFVGNDGEHAPEFYVCDDCGAKSERGWPQQVPAPGAQEGRAVCDSCHESDPTVKEYDQTGLERDYDNSQRENPQW